MAKSSKAVPSPSITEQMTELSELVEQLEDPEIELEAALVIIGGGDNQRSCTVWICDACSLW